MASRSTPPPLAQTAPVAAQATPSPPTIVEEDTDMKESTPMEITETLKVRLPESYSGNRSELETFLLQCELYMHFNEDKFATKSSNALWTVSYLKGDAFKWIEPFLKDWFAHETLDRMMTQTRRIFEDWDGFKKEIRRVFGDFDAKKSAETAIFSLRQTGSTMAYATEFQRHAVSTGWDSQALISHYTKGLKDHVKLELARLLPCTNMVDLIETTVRIDNILYEFRKEQKGTRPPFQQKFYKPQPNYNKPRSYRNKHDPMELDAAQRPPLSDAERTRRRDQFLCFSCGKAGHMSRDCRVSVAPGKGPWKGKKPRGRQAGEAAKPKTQPKMNSTRQISTAERPLWGIPGVDQPPPYTSTLTIARPRPSGTLERRLPRVGEFWYPVYDRDSIDQRDMRKWLMKDEHGWITAEHIELREPFEEMVVPEFLHYEVIHVDSHRIAYKVSTEQYHTEVLRTGQRFISGRNPRVSDHYALYHEGPDTRLFITATNEVQLYSEPRMNHPTMELGHIFRCLYHNETHVGWLDIMTEERFDNQVDPERDSENSEGNLESSEESEDSDNDSEGDSAGGAPIHTISRTVVVTENSHARGSETASLESNLDDYREGVESYVRRMQGARLRERLGGVSPLSFRNPAIEAEALAGFTQVVMGRDVPIFNPRSLEAAERSVPNLPGEWRSPYEQFTITAIIHNVQTIVMIDSGAMGNFMSKEFVEQNSIPISPVPNPYPLSTVDGSTAGGKSSMVQYETKNLTVTTSSKPYWKQENTEQLHFDVAPLGHWPVIFGITWLRKNNPEINWVTGEFKFRPSASRQ